ncbi:MAG: SusC/RagA family TonB-linked outer membrane protein [Sphingobacteriaceae bacterium]|nr:SusC/RagA family TonB-linked outer membrane protein [Sphingobacteriaceae bacterium]
MYKNYTYKSAVPYRSVNKVLSIMKLTTVILLVTFVHVSAASLAQKISLNEKEISLKKVFKKISTQTGYSFIISGSILKQSKSVTINVEDAELRDVLDIILKDQPIEYQIQKNTIILNIPDRISSQPKIQNKDVSQEKIVGKITNETGSALVGVTVKIKSTGKGTVTDVNGTFSIHAVVGDVLVISYVGFEKTEYTIIDHLPISIFLKESKRELNAVVITALGIKRSSKSLTYNVQELENKDVTSVKDANFVNSLNGKVAGATINASSSGLGGSVRVVLRGVKSLTGNNNALYVVDGIPLPNLLQSQPDNIFARGEKSGDGISNLNPEDIESISVLTGAASAALYGSQAANGAILITTKKGTVGKTKINFSSNLTFSRPFVLPELQNEYGTSGKLSYMSYGPKLDQPSTYNVADFFQRGTNYTNALDISAGNEKNQTYFSVASLNGKGIIPNHKLNRYNFTVRNTSTLIPDKLTMDFSAMYVLQDQQNVPGQGRFQNPLLPIYLFPPSESINDVKNFERFNPTRNFNTQYWPFGDLGIDAENPYWRVNREIDQVKRERFLGTLSLKYNITPDLNLGGRIKYDNTTDMGEGKYYASTYFLFVGGNNGGYNTSKSNNKQTYADLLLTYNKIIKDFTITAILGGSVLDNKNSSLNSGGALGLIPNFFSLNNINRDKITYGETIQQQDQTRAVFASGTFGYKQKLFLDFTARRDWASGLAFTNSASIFYPSAGLSAIISEWLRMPSFINYAKVRSSYSEVGNAPQRYLSNPTYTITPGTVNTITLAPFTTLKPERTSSIEGGLDVRMFDNNLTLNLTYYYANTDNQLFTVTVPSAVGVSGYYINGGKVNNQGLEATLGITKQLGAITWEPNVTFALNRNKIKQLLPSFIDPYTGVLRNQDSIAVAGNVILTKGGTTGDIYYAGLQRDERGNYITDTNGLPLVARIPKKIGSTNPDYNVGFNNNFRFKGFNLGFLITARLGGTVVSQTQSLLDFYGVSKTSAVARNNGGIDINNNLISAKDYYAAITQSGGNALALYSYDASNVRLAEFSFGYIFPSKIFRNYINNVRLSIVARNLWMIYNKAPYDPESVASTSTFYQGYDYFNSPSQRTLGFKLNASF